MKAVLLMLFLQVVTVAATLLFFGAAGQDQMEKLWKQIEIKRMEDSVNSEQDGKIQDRIYRAQKHQSCMAEMEKMDVILHEIAAQHARYEIDIKVRKRWETAVKKVRDCL